MNLDYFYDYEAEQFAFYMVPKEIVEEEPFCNMSNGSKLLYSIVLDRVKLSRRNGWIDEKRRVYIIFTVEETQRIMRCSKPTATKFMQELVKIGLVEKKRQGLGKPNLLYVKNFVRKGKNSNFKRFNNLTSGSTESEHQEVQESNGINNNQINPDFINTDPFFPSAPKEVGQKDGMSEREKIKHQIEYDCLRQRYRAEQLDELVEIMLEVMMNRSPTIKIGRDAEYPTSYVQERLSKINAMHIERVMDGIADNRTQVYNTRAYLLATLFNSVSTIDSYNTMQYNHDFGGSW